MSSCQCCKIQNLKKVIMISYKVLFKFYLFNLLKMGLNVVTMYILVHDSLVSVSNKENKDIYYNTYVIEKVNEVDM